MASARGSSVIRDAVAITATAGILFVSTEAGIRTFWPQNLRPEDAGGASTAIPDDELGHRLRPNARAPVSHLNDRGNRAVADYLTAVLVERFGDRSRHPQTPVAAGPV